MHPSRLAALAPQDDGTLRARVGGPIGADQAFGIDLGINLRGRQRGVAEQFLDRADVAAASEQVRGERMAQRVRRRGFRQR